MPQSYFVKSKEKHLEFTKHIYVKYSMPLLLLSSIKNNMLSGRGDEPNVGDRRLIV